MKTVFRFLVTATGLTLILIALGLILLSTQAGAATDLAVERGLEYVYQTEVAIDRVTFLPRESSMVIHGLEISNPEEFKDGTAISINEVAVDIDPATLLSAQPVVEQVVLRGAQFNLRYEAGRGTNLGKLDENASRAHADGNLDTGSLLLSRDYIVREFRSDKSDLRVSANFLPGTGLNLTLAPFELEGLGGPAPVSTARLCALLIRGVFQEALSLRGLTQPAADKLNDELQRLLEQDEED